MNSDVEMDTNQPEAPSVEMMEVDNEDDNKTSGSIKGELNHKETSETSPMDEQFSQIAEGLDILEKHTQSIIAEMRVKTNSEVKDSQSTISEDPKDDVNSSPVETEIPCNTEQTTDNDAKDICELLPASSDSSKNESDVILDASDINVENKEPSESDLSVAKDNCQEESCTSKITIGSPKSNDKISDSSFEIVDVSDTETPNEDIMVTSSITESKPSEEVCLVSDQGAEKISPDDDNIESNSVSNKNSSKCEEQLSVPISEVTSAVDDTQKPSDENDSDKVNQISDISSTSDVVETSMNDNSRSDVQPLDFSVHSNKSEKPKKATKSKNSSIASSTGYPKVANLAKDASKSPKPQIINEHIIALEAMKQNIGKHLNENNIVDASIIPQPCCVPAMNVPHECCPLKAKINADNAENLEIVEISNEETGLPEIFSGLVTVGKYKSIKGDFSLQSAEALIDCPSLVDNYLLKEPDKFPVRETEIESMEPKDFFNSSPGKLLIGIGLNRVKEWYHKDMAKINKKKILKGQSVPSEDIELHEGAYAEAKTVNEPYTTPFRKCKICNFVTESAIVLEGHMLVPHMTPNKEYQCNFCPLTNRVVREVLRHMLYAHGKAGKEPPPPNVFECPYCIFQCGFRLKLKNHIEKCEKIFNPSLVQAPPRDFEMPTLTSKPITVALVKNYEQSISLPKGRSRIKKAVHTQSPCSFPRNPTPFTPPPNQFNACQRLPNSMSFTTPPNFMPSAASTPFVQRYPSMASETLFNSASQFPISSNNAKKVCTTKATSNMTNGTVAQSVLKSHLQCAIPSTNPHSENAFILCANGMVICEICDGFLQDLEHLRTHVLYIHKIRLHPKMLYNRPPLNCQRCSRRFFTDQGLERHLLGVHGLITSNMQELTSKNKDSGSCVICGKVYACKLVNHMREVHNVPLKPAHISYKCTVCAAAFNLYRLFENHVYLVHSKAVKTAVA